MLESLGLEVWHLWLLAACIIAVIELVMVGSYYLLALSAGAAAVGIVAAMTDISLAAQWLLFGLATGVAAVLMRYLRTPEDDKRADDISYMVGKLVTVVEKIAPRGRVDYKSVGWAAESDQVPEAGESARITRVDGSTLYVMKLEENS